jgi:integrase/recombinase XerD
MKIDRHGQAEIISKSNYSKIRSAFTQEHHRLLWDIAYYTGERWGAIVQLQVSDVYDGFGRPRSTIIYRKNTRKDKATREVPVSDALRLRLASYAVPDRQWLFEGAIKNSPVTIRAIDGALRRAIDRAGLSGLGISTHSTRRTFITALDRAGISIKVIQSLTGHKSLANLARYIDVSDEQKTNAVAVL